LFGFSGFPFEILPSGKVYLKLEEVKNDYSRNAESRPEAVIEQLVGRQGQPRGAQVHTMHLSDRKEWSQDLPLPSPHLRLAVEVRAFLSLDIPAYLRPSEGKQLFSFASVAALSGLVLICCSQRLCHSVIIVVLSIPFIALQVREVAY